MLCPNCIKDVKAHLSQADRAILAVLARMPEKGATQADLLDMVKLSRFKVSESIARLDAIGAIYSKEKGRSKEWKLTNGTGRHLVREIGAAMPEETKGRGIAE